MLAATHFQLATQLGQLLLQRQQTVTLAESCTGGLLAAAITAVPGASAWFEMAWISYANHAKQQFLGVPFALLQAEGAVSAGVVEAMAHGALQQAGAHLSLAVSGVAGPGGGSAEKPVGTVFVASAYRPALEQSAKVLVQRHQFTGERAAIRLATVAATLQQAWQMLTSIHPSS